MVGLRSCIPFWLVEDFTDSLHLTLLGHREKRDFMRRIRCKNRRNRAELRREIRVNQKDSHGGEKVL
jgi:hypothetical protein